MKRLALGAASRVAVFRFAESALLALPLLLGSAAPASAAPPASVVLDDVSRLHPTSVRGIVPVHNLEEIQATLAEARANDWKVSIAGKRHSMGGHAFAPEAVVLDMTSFNRVLGVDPVAKTIRVESGATWEQVIAAANPHGLAVEVMQAYSGFTIGGSLSVNVHESDPRFGPLVGSVRSFRLLLADGSIVNVSRTENAELFGLVIGGYGLFGIVLDVELALTDNHLLEKGEEVIDVADYLALFRQRKADPTVENLFARLSIAPDPGRLRELVVTTYRVSQRPANREHELATLKPGGLKRFLFGLSRRFDWGKRFRWWLQRRHSGWFEPSLVSRNNLMNSDLRYLAHGSPKDTDILQEYFVPVDRLPAFVDELRRVVAEHRLNLLSATIRYVPHDEESVLSYSRPPESFGLVLYLNVGRSTAAQTAAARWTHELIDRALAEGGTYYLPYVPYATPEQFRAAYPRAAYVYEKKRQYDPQERFVNGFYLRYIRPDP